jgi:hypothetical protein
LKRDELAAAIERCAREAAHCARNGLQPGISDADRVGAMRGECDWLAEKAHYEAELVKLTASPAAA